MPIAHFKCKICGASAPRKYLVHSKFKERLRWLRRHYRARHPREFKKWYRGR